MKRFVVKGLLFYAVILGICSMCVLLSTREPTRSVMAELTKSEEFMDYNEMLPVFERAEAQDGTPQLIVGDSICRQLFYDIQEYNPQVSILATNASLLIPGQYLLIERYINCHPEATDVFLVIHPLPLTRSFDLEWGYRNAVMTYVETDTYRNLDQNTRDIIENVYGTVWTSKPMVQLAESCPIVRKLCLSYLFMNKKSYEQDQSFEMADQYVKKIYDVCQQNGIKLHLQSAPVSEFYREKVNELSETFSETWISQTFPDYFEDILYYSNEKSADGSHFSGEYADREKLNEIIQEAYGEKVLAEQIRFK